MSHQQCVRQLQPLLRSGQLLVWQAPPSPLFSAFVLSVVTPRPYGWDSTTISPGFLHDFSRIPPRFLRDFSEISPGFLHDFSEISPRFSGISLRFPRVSAAIPPGFSSRTTHKPRTFKTGGNYNPLRSPNVAAAPYPLPTPANDHVIFPPPVGETVQDSVCNN